MFYEPPHRDKALLPHDPLKAIVAPRPIGWISTVSAAGVANLAPYSFFNMFSENPWIVGFSSNTQKDSMRNIAETGEFVYNLATRSQIDDVNRSSVPAPPEIDEFALLGIDSAKSHKVKPRRVAASPCAFECKWIETITLKGVSGKPTDWFLVLGEVLGVHIDESVVENGKVDVVKLQSLARCGYMDFTWVQSIASRERPTWA
jgi:flavin reductase (DIM6/NTAB) family NADH-FMN oxidoreductase RutF